MGNTEVINLRITSSQERDRWEAVLLRDGRWDGAFVYAVRSTGIYCRPSCPSRRPRREQVDFFPLPEVAERAGFRACLRCHPREAQPVEPQMELIQKVCRHIEAGVEGEEPLSLSALSELAGLSPYHLQRTFKRITGISPRQYAEACRVGRLKARLKGGDNVTTALYEAGYNSSSRLYELAPATLGMTPSAYRRGGLGMRIGYTITDCRLGRLLVAATERGVCAVSLGDSDAELESGLRREYPAADIHPDGSVLSDWVQAIVSHLEGKHPHLDLPIDVQATAFQRRVWEELQKIPYGSTLSYGQVAQALGNAGAARAVAQACATNPVALIIPCHRVVGAHGSLGGYRWGVARKRQLLEGEGR